MNRRGLFKGFAALVGVAAIGPAVARDPEPELHIESANSGVIRAGSIRSEDGSMLISFGQNRIYISTKVAPLGYLI